MITDEDTLRAVGAEARLIVRRGLQAAFPDLRIPRGSWRQEGGERRFVADPRPILFVSEDPPEPPLVEVEPGDVWTPWGAGLYRRDERGWVPVGRTVDAPVEPLAHVGVGRSGVIDVYERGAEAAQAILDRRAAGHEGVPNTIRCVRCDTLLLIDLLNEGFDPAEIVAKRAAHDRRFHE